MITSMMHGQHKSAGLSLQRARCGREQDVVLVSAVVLMVMIGSCRYLDVDVVLTDGDVDFRR